MTAASSDPSRERRTVSRVRAPGAREASAEERLSAGRRIILYELRMLRAATSYCLDPTRDRSDPHLGSALTDSLLLHARNLFEFLTEMPRQSIRPGGTIVAGCYLKNSEGEPWRPSQLTVVKSLIKDINIFSSHPSFTRADYKLEWPRAEITREIEDAFEDFLSRLPHGEQLKWQHPEGPWRERFSS